MIKIRNLNLDNIIIWRPSILAILIILNIAGSNAAASMAQIIESGIFGCTKDTSAYSDRYIFTKLPGLVLENEQTDTRLTLGDNKETSFKMLSGQVLINEIDSSKYYLGDEINSFSNVVRNYLPSIISNNWNLELVQFYLMASNIEPAINYSYFDQSGELTWFCNSNQVGFDSLPKHNNRIPPEYYPIELTYINSKNLRLKILQPNNLKSNIETFITTWEPYYGDIEQRVFETSSDEFKLNKYKGLYWGVKSGSYSNSGYNQKENNSLILAEPSFIIGISGSRLSRHIIEKLSLPDTTNRDYGYFTIGISEGVQLRKIQLFAKVNGGFSHSGSDSDTLPLANKKYGTIAIMAVPYLIENKRFQIKPLLGVQYSSQYFDEERIENMKYKGERTFALYGIKSYIFLKTIGYPNFKLVDTDRIVVQIGYERDFAGIRYHSITLAIGMSGGENFMGDTFMGLGYNYESYKGICKSYSLYLTVFKP